MKSVTVDRLVIPELEKLAKTYVPRGWSEKDKMIVRSYWGRIETKDILPHLSRKVSVDSVRGLARRLGL